MASRDLTSSFLERRAAANMRRRNNQNGYSSQLKKLTAGGSDELLIAEEEGIQMTSLSPTVAALPPQWVDDVDAVNAEVSEIIRMMELLQSLHSSRVGSVFGKDLDDMEGKIERVTQDVTDRFRQAERYLQRVGVATRRAGGEEATVGANVQRSLAKRLQELSAEFRQSQRKYLAEVQSQKSGGVTGDTKFGIDLNTESENFFSSSQQLSVVGDLTEAVHSRDQEIASIAQSIEELGTIFKELAVLVIDQGTILDRIDYNMEAVVEHTKTGIQQLEKAEKSQKSARPMKCIICLLCVIALLLVILVLKHRKW
eukprot:CAMPEP_0194168370 /NCGR_PEP_ID=MMETSP0154-20130528/3367_1 /TAXON_ID=1049557 /ORGANISM="Thalassiothrix antarctica, Strain L6-D1" /LENGTH=311 /DNA_ID=CAMNT_0038879501 /DNA_START=24 /DNA_END=959 /DNA_ORIENTATION=-